VLGILKERMSGVDNERVAKRRKLAWEQSEVQSQPPTTLNGDDVTVSSTSAQSLYDDWARAKAFKKAYRKTSKTPAGKDVYDDVDGAHPSPPKKGASTAKKRTVVDPLRNQRYDGPQSSPIKKSSAGLGFFKQFHSPNHECRTTFEDQIKEVEEKARKTAAAEDGVVTGSNRRTSGRHKRVGGMMSEGSDQEGEDNRKSKWIAGVKSRPINSESSMLKRLKNASKSMPCGPKEATQRSKMIESEVEFADNAGVGPACSRKFASKSTLVKSQPQQSSKRSQSARGISLNHLAAIQRIVLEKLIGKRATPLINLNNEYSKVSQIITQSIKSGESNSILLIGARGSGKTSLVNEVLREQHAKHAQDFHVVRLNGFIHTDDKIALKEIWRQLGHEMELGEDESHSKNYADTLTTLLALLSHPAEQGREEGSDRVTKSVIFVLDEFELFASHPRQTLLYNLFDIAQSRKAPIAVLGLTTRIDVAESLEKRVKSRFSHRHVHLGLAKNFSAFSAACKAKMTIEPDELRTEERLILEKTVTRKGKSGDAISTWKSLLDNLFATPTFETHLRGIYYSTKSVPEFMTSMLMSMSTLPVKDIEIDSILSHLVATQSLNPPDSKLSLLASLSTLQLALLICAARLTNIYDTDLVSFNLAYEEYKVLSSKAKLQGAASSVGARTSSKGVARVAWEELVSMALVIEDGRAGAGTGKVDVGLEEIKTVGVELGGWARWCKEI